MYKAIQEIGGYKVGEIVPDEKAEAWLSMYVTPPVKKIEEEIEESVPEKKNISEPESSDVMLDDYLNRSTNNVKKAIEEDSLTKEQLDKLLKLEKSDKKREKVVNSILSKLNEMEG